VPVVSTSDAVALLDQSPATASKTMERLAAAELVRPIRRGLWSLEPNIDPYLVAGHLVAPYPAYVSLWSALYLRELIEQIPSSIYVASLARAQEIRTTVGTYSIHRLTPELFGGFEIKEPSGVKLATAEWIRARFPAGRVPRRYRRPGGALVRSARLGGSSSVIPRRDEPRIVLVMGASRAASTTARHGALDPPVRR